MQTLNQDSALEFGVDECDRVQLYGSPDVTECSRVWTEVWNRSQNGARFSGKGVPFRTFVSSVLRTSKL